MAHKILILDGNTVNPGDISWQALEALEPLGGLKIYDRTPQEQIVERIQQSQAQIVLTNKCNMNGEIMRQCPKLRFIGLFATGYNNLDIAAAKELGIAVANVPDYSSFAVAQMVFAMILNFTNQVHYYSDEVHKGTWSKATDFCFWTTPLMELKDKSLGLLGFGSIAQKVARIGESLGMQVLCHSRTPRTGAEFVGFEELLERSDFLSIHCPLQEKTRGIFNMQNLQKMKATAYLINTARGPIVDENAVAQALKQKIIAGYACDVAAKEPIPADSPLLGAPNCVITPHIAWAPKETRLRLLQIVAENIRAFLADKPQNLVS